METANWLLQARCFDERPDISGIRPSRWPNPANTLRFRSLCPQKSLSGSARAQSRQSR